MKTKSKTALILPLVILATVTVAIASDTTAKKSENQKAEAQPNASKNGEEQVATMTGSHIKRTVRKAGYVTDGVSPLTIINRAAIERSGATTVRQVLGKTGVGR
jgi:outer membrane cobalamin receptor